jgi:hypothetical protein
LALRLGFAGMMRKSKLFKGILFVGVWTSELVRSTRIEIIFLKKF